ncbi:MAG: hypothetical protein ACT4RN_12250 [Pseudonocardia sp.]
MTGMSALNPSGTAADPLVPADLRGWRTRVVAAVRGSFGPLLRLHLLALLVGALLAAAVLGLLVAQILAVPDEGPGPYDSTLAFLVMLAGALLILGAVLVAQAASAFVVVRRAQGGPATVGAGLRFASSCLWPLLGWGLLGWGLVGACVVAAVAVSSWFLVPAVYLAAVLAAGLIGVVVVEQRGLWRCVVLVHRRLLPTLGRMLLLFVVLLGFAVVVGLAGGAVIRALPEAALVVFVADLLLCVPLGVLAVPAGIVTYAELRAREQPGVGTPLLAAELDGKDLDVPEVTG